MLSMLDQLEATQWWTAAELYQHQMRQVQSLIHHAVTHVPFYGGGEGETPTTPAADSMPDCKDWAKLPVLTRVEVQNNYDALRSRQVPEAHGTVTDVNSSGSTGRPVTVRTTRLARMFAAISGLRAHRWHDRDLSGKLALIHIDREERAVYPDGLAQPGWGWPASHIYRTGPAAMLTLRTPIADQVEWLQRQNPDYLLSCPSNLLVLAEYFSDHGIALPRLRGVATIMEVVTPELRDACRRAWGLPVVDMYTTKEAGAIALQCPEHEHYHVMAEDVLVEVLDEDGSPCHPGEVGRVVVTPLHNYAMPLLRYEIGDYAEVGAPCSCGRGLPVLNRILGRVRNMLILPDGTRYWPSVKRRKLVENFPVTQHQLVQKDPGTLEFRLVTARALTVGEQNEIRTLILERLPCPFDIAIKRVDRIERGPGGKFEDFYSEIAR